MLFVLLFLAAVAAPPVDSGTQKFPVYYSGIAGPGGGVPTRTFVDETDHFALCEKMFRWDMQSVQWAETCDDQGCHLVSPQTDPNGCYVRSKTGIAMWSTRPYCKVGILTSDIQPATTRSLYCVRAAEPAPKDSGTPSARR